MKLGEKLPLLLKPEIFLNFDGILAVMSTKDLNLNFTNNANPELVKENRKIFLSQIGISEGQLAIPKQIHSANFCLVNSPGIYENCDALMTNKTGIYLVVSVADCAPVFVFDPIKKAIALIHCGWRGAKEKIVEKTIYGMRDSFGSDPRDLIVYIGACASVCCYEVDFEFQKFFNRRFLRFKRDGKYHFDLKSEIFSQLVNSGVKFWNISVSKHCTICEDKMFHSYRRDRDKSGRMWAVFGLNS
jgi:YfiH family protein